MVVLQLNVLLLDRLPFRVMPLSLAEELLISVLVVAKASLVDSELALLSVLDVASDKETASPAASSMTEDVASSVEPAAPSSELASADVVWTDVVPTLSTISDRSVVSTPAVRSTKKEAILAIFKISVALKAFAVLVASRLTLPTDQASPVSMAVAAFATDFSVSEISAPTRTSVDFVVLDKRPLSAVSTAHSTSVAAPLEVASVATLPLDVFDPSAAPVVSADSTRTLPQEVKDFSNSVAASSLLALMAADPTSAFRDSAAARPSQVVNARHPLSVSKRDNSSVRRAISELDSPPRDPPIRLLSSKDVSERESQERPPFPTAAKAATEAAMAAKEAAMAATEAAMAAAEAAMAAATAAASVAASAASAAEVATVASDGESINTDKEQTGLSVISDIELFLNTLCSLVELLDQICVLRARGYKNLPKLRKKIISTNHFFI